LETVSAYQVSGRTKKADELILGFWVLIGAWKFFGMAVGLKSIARGSLQVEITINGFRANISATGLSLIVGVQDLIDTVSLPFSCAFGLQC